MNKVSEKLRLEVSYKSFLIAVIHCTYEILTNGDFPRTDIKRPQLTKFRASTFKNDKCYMALKNTYYDVIMLP